MVIIFRIFFSFIIKILINLQLEYKLKKLDSLYTSKSDELNLKLKLDDKMILYQNSLEEKLRKEYQEKVNN